MVICTPCIHNFFHTTSKNSLALLQKCVIYKLVYISTKDISESKKILLLVVWHTPGH